MNFLTIWPRGFASNTYLVYDTARCIVIDPGQERIASILREKGLRPDYVLLTHGHFDHVSGVAAVQAMGAKVGCLKEEVSVIRGDAALAGMCDGFPPFNVDFTFGEGELDLGGVKVRVIATPGHTVGGCCYLVEDRLFSGDTLFCDSCGRTDLPTGSTRELVRSLRKLFALQGDYIVYPGHGEQTTLSHERKYNPYAKL
ncbi:MAG: MBL fold metallo-hydrolase [Christensenellaceae bacterium]